MGRCEEGYRHLKLGPSWKRGTKHALELLSLEITVIRLQMHKTTAAHSNITRVEIEVLEWQHMAWNTTVGHVINQTGKWPCSLSDTFPGEGRSQQLRNRSMALIFPIFTWKTFLFTQPWILTSSDSLKTVKRCRGENTWAMCLQVKIKTVIFTDSFFPIVTH